MAFGDGYFVSNIEVPGFRAATVGALSSDWTLASDTQSTRDLAVKLDNVNICWETTAAVVSGTAWWKTVVSDFRLYASLRGSSVASAHANIFASWIPDVGQPAGTGLAHWLDVAVGSSANIGTINDKGAGAVSFSATVTANLWYRVMLERVGTVIRFWFNATGNADPRSLTDSGLQLLRETETRHVAVRVGIHASPTAGGVSNYCGVSDMLLQTLTERTTETGSTPGSAQLVSPLAGVRDYRHYKAVRQAIETFNNLKLGP